MTKQLFLMDVFALDRARCRVKCDIYIIEQYCRCRNNKPSVICDQSDGQHNLQTMITLDTSGDSEAPLRGSDGKRTTDITCCGNTLWKYSSSPQHRRCKFCFVECQCTKRQTDDRNQGNQIEMSRCKRFFGIFMKSAPLTVLVVVLLFLGIEVFGDTNKYRVCVVDGRGGFKRAAKYCPILDKPDSKVECVIGTDRLDCLRRISKGKVDFSVMTAEDLVAATNSQVEVLITNELRFSNQKYEYEVVAVVRDSSGIRSKYDLQDKRLCHPGYGYEVDWTRILANYFESIVVPKLCDETLTLTENRIKASSKFFKSACKAGSWVSDSIVDETLKQTYPNLCDLCSNPGRCSNNDKYWGRRGPLYCLTDGIGDVSWVRLDDTLSHFGLSTTSLKAASPDGYSYLCPDGSRKPLNSTVPCVWVSRPWPVITTKRTSAQEIQRFINRLDHNDTSSWQNALLNLIEHYHVEFGSLDPIQNIESYLIDTPGFLSANSFSGCHPPRSIRICTTSIIENAKCGWMREAAAVYGIEPDFDCVKGDNKTHCMHAVQFKLADVVMVSPDLLMSAQRNYQLKTLFYEDVNPDDRYETVAIVRPKSNLKKFSDLKGKSACFPSYEGIAWNTMLYEFHRRGLLSNCPFSHGAANFFGDTCAPGVPDTEPESLKALCNSKSYEEDVGALKCFVLENADVAFVSKNSLKKLMSGQLSSEKWVNKLLEKEHMNTICEDELKPCELSWSTISQAMIRSDVTEMKKHEMFDAFMRIDDLFGTAYKSLTRSFSLYGPFDGNHNILFRDETVKLRGETYMKKIEKSIPSYESILKDVSECVPATSSINKPYIYTLIATVLVFLNVL